MTTPDFNELSEAFSSGGYVAVPDALPIEVAMNMQKVFKESDFDYIEQTRKNHFSHVFKTDQVTLPREDETYIARFFRSNGVERHPDILQSIAQYIAPIVAKVSGLENIKYELRGYKLQKSCVIRTHIDDYMGRIGFIYYLSSRWQWDWGGLLTVVENNVATSILPNFNQLIIVDHGKHRQPHFVSEVSDYALEPRLMLIGFSGDQYIPD
jgi:Rps23 Pro-64 3,4-dihydroxylase Tpa1-like proline 4-hydroxylase